MLFSYLFNFISFLLHCLEFIHVNMGIKDCSYVSIIHFHFMYVWKLLCANPCYCCPLLQPLYVMVMVNVMITNNPNQCITNCVMQGLTKMCRSGNRTLNLCHPVFLQAIWCRGVLQGSPWMSSHLILCVRLYGSLDMSRTWNVHTSGTPRRYVCVLLGNHMSRAQFGRNCSIVGKQVADTCCRWSAKSKLVFFMCSQMTL